MKTAFIFPGQGAQAVGMGRDIARKFDAAAKIFDRANAVLGFDLSNICFEGPAEKLNTTTISQPAIFVTSAAILAVVKTSISAPDITAGLSLGEYTALYAAGIISFEDALTLVQKRGQAMQAAADATDGGMVSIIGLDEEKVSRLCAEACPPGRAGEVLAAVNFNCPGQIVISGSKAACSRAEGLAEKYGAIKAVRLEVAGAFHTEMMVTAANALEDALRKCGISEPGNIKTIANINAEYYKSAGKIAEGLKRQLTCPVLWQKCMERLIADGVEDFYEIGPGKVLTGLLRRIDRKKNVINISSLQAVEELL